MSVTSPPATTPHDPHPARPWVLAMQWLELLFMHWPVSPDTLKPFIPPPLVLDTFDGAAWLGVVSFRMSHVRPRLVPSVSAVSDFPELNLRTYVKYGMRHDAQYHERPGIWFFSLDVTNPLAVTLARRLFHLPYYRADMRVSREGDTTHYASRRTHPHASPASFVGRYRPTGQPYHSTAGSLEHFLTERYCFYSRDRQGHLYRADVRHPRWPLQAAEVEVESNHMSEQIGLTLPASKPVLHYAGRLEVVAHWPVRVGHIL